MSDKDTQNFFRLEKRVHNTENIELVASPEQLPATYSLPSFIRCLKFFSHKNHKLDLMYTDPFSSGQTFIEYFPHDKGDNFMPMQNHNYLELYYVVSGELKTQIENQIKRFHSGDAILLNMTSKNKLLDSPDTVFYTLALTPQFFHQWPIDYEMPAYRQTPTYNFISRNIRSDSGISKEYLEFTQKKIPPDSLSVQGILEQISDQLTGKAPGYSYIIYGLIIRLCSILETDEYYQLTLIRTDSDSDKHICEKMKSYLEEHRRRVTLKEVGAHLYYSEIYLSQIFRKYVGESFQCYNQRVYFEEAKHLLLDTNQSISSIIQQLNFSNHTQFYKLFQNRFHCTPLEFREKHR